MILLLTFAFMAGIVTILSPCILPILPIVLSGSVGEGKRRPIGIIIGFIASFTFFTLFLSAIVKLTGISPDALRVVSVSIIIFFGASLLIPPFQTLIEKSFSHLARIAPKNSLRTGFWGGFVVGLSLGLVWTPCVGPILASVISLSFTGTVTNTALLIIIAYSIGTAIPMFIIMYSGRKLLSSHPGLLRNSVSIQKTFGIIMIITAIGIFFNLDRKFQSYILEKFPNYGTGLTQFEENPTIRTELNKLRPTNLQLETTTTIGKSMNDFLDNSEIGKAPDFIAGGQWFNSPPLSLKQLRGKVVLIDFWTYTCINCIRTLPYTKSWYQKYKDKGFVLVGIHTPEFEFEKNSDNVAKAIKDFDITYPVVQDNNYATWNAYQNQYWPAEYFIDATGKIRKTHFGEGNYDENEMFIQTLLKEAGSLKNTEPVSNPSYSLATHSPETYLGNKRIEYIIPSQQIQVNSLTTYKAPTDIPLNQFAFDGNWTINDEYAIPEAGARLIIQYDSQNVYLVMKPKEKQLGKVKVLIDGKILTTMPGTDVVDGEISVDSDRLYTLIKHQKEETHILTIEFEDANLQLFAFTFG